jgi:ABC-2 type transport system permease protein
MRISHIFHLGVKELISLIRDPILVLLILYAFSIAIYSAAMSLPETLHKASISIVDEDRSELSKRIVDAFYLPYFTPPILTTLDKIDQRMNAGLDTFTLIIPTKFEQDLLAQRHPVIQLNIDATRVSQALTGNEDIQQIILGEVTTFLKRHRVKNTLKIDVPFRIMFNPELKESWFGGVMELISNITFLSVILTGAALIREREHGTVEHLLVMPVTPFEIMTSKIWAMGVVVLLISFISLELIIQLWIGMPIEGSRLLFMIGATFHLFATTALGIFLGTFARSMSQFALITCLVLLPMQVLSGGVTPRESMPEFIQHLMLLTPNTHFVILSQAILYRGAGIEVVWPQFLSLALIGSVIFAISLTRFRKTLSLMT